MRTVQRIFFSSKKRLNESFIKYLGFLNQIIAIYNGIFHSRGHQFIKTGWEFYHIISNIRYQDGILLLWSKRIKLKYALISV